ncbi:hypothetical protein LAUMK13_01673 [Mycobacterium innocens]|uniref:Uncharacterized protein n=1 Tax=Mycobacterium innocens TaxID=2341083 RepID=A0A498PX27_9MYCO|nr:hypothetical protein LAUMK13_01673 [Mycobacterium innocens]
MIFDTHLRQHFLRRHHVPRRLPGRFDTVGQGDPVAGGFQLGLDRRVDSAGSVAFKSTAGIPMRLVVSEGCRAQSSSQSSNRCERAEARQPGPHLDKLGPTGEELDILPGGSRDRDDGGRATRFARYRVICEVSRRPARVSARPARSRRPGEPTEATMDRRGKSPPNVKWRTHRQLAAGRPPNSVPAEPGDPNVLTARVGPAIIVTPAGSLQSNDQNPFHSVVGAVPPTR